MRNRNVRTSDKRGVAKRIVDGEPNHEKSRFDTSYKTQKAENPEQIYSQFEDFCLITGKNGVARGETSAGCYDAIFVPSYGYYCSAIVIIAASE